MAQSVGPMFVLGGIMTLLIAGNIDFTKYGEPDFSKNAELATWIIGSATLLFGIAITTIGFRKKLPTDQGCDE
tara:strand:+ start:361 stop:579 length:219 start_codon:yes stop_codon:yes gene_type:complete